MKRQLSIAALAVAVALTAVPAHADVKKEERNQISFAGMLGKVVNFFGGKGAREGVVSSVAVSGDRKMTVSGDNTAQIVDLREEKVYDINMRNKTYKVTTFEQIRQQMREAEARAREAAAKETASEPTQKPQPSQQEKPAKEVEIDFDVKNTGQTKTINGFETRQVVATIAVREKGKKLEDSGGLVMTVDTWLTKQVDLKEIGDFERRYWEKLAGPMIAANAEQAQQMATAIAMYPGLKDAFARLSKEDLGGTAIQTVTTVQAVKSAEQVKEEAARSSSSSSSTASNDSAPPTSIGGAIGGFMRRRQQQQQEQKSASASTDPSRATFMTINNEVLKIDRNVSAADVALPAGFKENK
jgi:hypothetical protein